MFLTPVSYTHLDVYKRQAWCVDRIDDNDWKTKYLPADKGKADFYRNCVVVCGLSLIHIWFCWNDRFCCCLFLCFGSHTWNILLPHPVLHPKHLPKGQTSCHAWCYFCLLYTSIFQHWHMIMKRRHILMEQVIVQRCGKLFSQWQNPVSYTHLDVYKRQPMVYLKIDR